MNSQLHLPNYKAPQEEAALKTTLKVFSKTSKRSKLNRLLILDTNLKMISNLQTCYLISLQ